MRNIGIRYYKMGLYNEEQFALFVKRGFVTPEEYLELTGVEYDQEKVNVQNDLMADALRWLFNLSKRRYEYENRCRFNCKNNRIYFSLG